MQKLEKMGDNLINSIVVNQNVLFAKKGTYSNESNSRARRNISV